MKITIKCGTRNLQKITIDLDFFGSDTDTGASNAEKMKAIDLIIRTMDDPDFANDGHRNKCAVNLCIALHVLGYDPLLWTEAFCNWAFQDKGWFWSSDLDKFMKHVERVCGYGGGEDYPKRWGPEGNEGRALDYVID
jgi:hypothetical protein